MGYLRPLSLCFALAACAGAEAVQTQEMSGGSAVAQATGSSPAGTAQAAPAQIAPSGPPAATGGAAGTAANRPAANSGVAAGSAATGVSAGAGASASACASSSAMACASPSGGASASAGASAIAGATANAGTSASAGTGASAGAGSPTSGNHFLDSFDGDGPLMGYTTNNASAIPDVTRVSGRYTAKLQSNANDITLHYNQSQGRLDARKLSFPFEVIARNIGIGMTADSQMAAAGGGIRFNLAGIQVHVLDFESRNSAHLVVGHSGTENFSIEGKSTVNGTSVWDNEGSNANPLGRADLRIVGNADRTISVYWQTPNADPAAKKDDWKPYKGTGKLSGPAPMFGQEVYVGLITYAVGETGVPFIGTCDSFEGRVP